jgi:hypothetical protein
MIMRLPLSPTDRENRRGCFFISLGALALLLIIVLLAIQAEEKPKDNQTIVTETR